MCYKSFGGLFSIICSWGSWSLWLECRMGERKWGNEQMSKPQFILVKYVYIPPII